MTKSHHDPKAIFFDAVHWLAVPTLLARVEGRDVQKALIPKPRTGTLGTQRRNDEPGLRRRKSTNSMQPRAAPMVVEEDVTRLVSLIVSESFEAVCTHVEAYLEVGHSASDLILQLLSPAAVMFGERWTDDDLSFSEVTLGMAMLHSLLHRFSQQLEEETTPLVQGATMMIAPYPGENHLFGVSIVEEFMRADGWDVGIAMVETGAVLVRKVRERHFDVVGLSLAHASQLSAMRQLIVAIRANSLNKRLSIVIGGPLVHTEPELVSGLPVEGIATDARQGLTLVRELLEKSRSDEADGNDPSDEMGAKE